MGGPMNDLIERIEAASGPDAILGRDILLACGWKKTHRGYFLGPLYGWSSPDYKTRFDDDDFERGRHNPTASIDAALTLVPEGFEWSLEYQDGHHVSSDGECMVAIAKLGDPCRGWESESYTPALALCAAALRARAYLKETNNAD